MPDDRGPQAPSTFILATLRDPALRLRRTLFVDIVPDGEGLRAVPRGIPLAGAGPDAEAALESLREALRARFHDLRKRRQKLEGEEGELYRVLRSLIATRTEEETAEIRPEVPIPDKLASFYGLKPGIVLALTVYRGMHQATWGRSYLSATGDTQDEAIRNFCSLIQTLRNELQDRAKRELQPNVWGFVEQLMHNPEG